MAQPLLYGVLTVTIKCAKGLKDADGWFGGASDAYCTVSLDKCKIARTKVKKEDQNPVFEEVFELQVNGRYNDIVFKVFDEDPCDPDDLLGYVAVPISDILSQERCIFKNTLELGPEPGEDARGKYGTLKVKVKYTSLEDLFNSYEVPDVSFPSRRGCRVTLFQDAHIGEDGALLPRVMVTPTVHALEVVADGEDDDVEEDNDEKKKRNKKNRRKRERLMARMKRKEKKLRRLHGLSQEDEEEAREDAEEELPLDEAPQEEWEFSRSNCWKKIYKSILRAKHFIYITGWSVDTSITLIREKPVFLDGEPLDEDDNGMMTIGELLKRKAKEGVVVNMLLWNEATSVSGMGKEGLMYTHDEFTRDYFTDTGVVVSLAYRDGTVSSGNKFLWTHHQKSIILDAESLREDELDLANDMQTDKRRIIGYVGGLDLCDGRWDTPRHSLFRTLQTHHANDFHQVWPDVSPTQGPREPWHDIHARIEGPIARDVMRNFEQRWRKQASEFAGNLVDIDDLPILSMEEDIVEDPSHWASWSVQLFRSIDDYSAVMENDEKVDKSIQLAYVHHIRRAKRFILIENQYFLGSAQAWEDGAGDGIECNNLVPLELTQKICAKIAAKQAFSVYVILPMYPEGIPADQAVQEILSWQHKTIAMMYAQIYRALEHADMLGEYKPEDYLLFFCLGNRETEEGSQAVVDMGVEERFEVPNQDILNASRRFAIYVHSKMMIVDDDYVIVGSANINERSMSGDRDSEIAIGAYQPHFTNETTSNQPRGYIHAFRLGLMTSHLRKNMPSLLEPESVQCARELNEIATENWNLFAGEEVVEMEEHGQLLKYPYLISDNGKVMGLPDNRIPDTQASVTGQDSTMLPNILTL